MFQVPDNESQTIHSIQQLFGSALKELEPKKLTVIGTGFYITRYGLFLTAKHVLHDVVDDQGRPMHRLFGLHTPDEKGILHLRQVTRFTSSNQFDIALGELENFIGKYPENPLANRRGKLTLKPPPINSSVVTYAYPENKILDFRDKGKPAQIVADYYDGALLKYVVESDNPFLPYPHYETNVRIRGGASGGPVFDQRGQIFAINCRGWDFDGGEHEGDELSIMVRINECLSLGLDQLKLPLNSWELRQIPVDHRGSHITIRDLARYGHVLLSPV